MDIMGPLKRTARGNEVILILTCAFSRYAEAIALPDQKSETIARAFVELIVCRHGMPKELLTDRGTNFLSKLFQNVCKILKIERKLTSSYHPMANGGAENCVKCIKNLIIHYVNEDHDDWDLYIPFILFAHRTAINSATLEAPYFLVHGRDPILPIDLIFKTPQLNIPHCESQDYKTQMVMRLQSAFNLAKSNLESARARQKLEYDKRSRSPEFNIGDRVFVTTVVVKHDQSAKFTPHWHGPYRIIEKISNILYKLDLGKSTAHPYLHTTRLKLCNERDENIFFPSSSLESNEPSNNLDSPSLTINPPLTVTRSSTPPPATYQPLYPHRILTPTAVDLPSVDKFPTDQPYNLRVRSNMKRPVRFRSPIATVIGAIFQATMT